MMTVNKLTKIVSGSLAIGILAGVGIASRPANAVEFACNASGITLDQLLGGDSILCDDKLFSDFVFLGVNTGNVNPIGIGVTGFIDNDTTPEFDPGLKFTDLNNQWDTRRVLGNIDYHFGYKVAVLDPDKWITDNYLKEFEPVCIPGALPTNCDSISVTEFVWTDAARTIQAQGVDPIDGGGIKNEKDVELIIDDDITRVDKRLDKLDFLAPGYKELWISKEVSLTVGGDTEARIVSFEQSFSQTTPEPGTILGLLAVGGAGLLSKLKKHK